MTTSCDIRKIPEIWEWIRIVRENVYETCEWQKLLVDKVVEAFETEDIYVDTDHFAMVPLPREPF